MRATIIQKIQDERDGSAPLYVRVSHRGRQLYHALGLTVPVERWDAAQGRYRGRSDEAKTVNALCSRAVSAAREAEVELVGSGREVTAARVRDAVRARLAPSDVEDRTDFLVYLRTYAVEFEARGGIRYAQRYRTMANKLERYARKGLGARSVTFGDLSGRAGAGYLRSYAAFVQRGPEEGGYGNSPNTAASNLRAIRTAVNRAIREGLMEMSESPFPYLTIREERVERVRLSTADVGRLAALPLAGPEGFPAAAAMERVARDAFLFSVYAAGMRFGDVAGLRWDGVAHDVAGGRVVRYAQQKTGTPKHVSVSGAAGAILDAYDARRVAWEAGTGEPWVFPFFDGYGLDAATGPEWRRIEKRARGSRNARVNQVLKSLAKAAKVAPGLHFHSARHTFAEVAMNAGWDVFDVSRSLGHKKIGTTEIYLSGMARADAGAKLDALFDHSSPGASGPGASGPSPST